VRQPLGGVRSFWTLSVGPFDCLGRICRMRQRLLNELERLGDVTKLVGDFGGEHIIHATSLV